MKSPAINQAMNILRELRSISEASNDIPEKMEKIVAMIVQQMEADAGTCYVVVDDNCLRPMVLILTSLIKFPYVLARDWLAK